MRKPRGGFKVLDNYPELSPHWTATLERLSQTGHIAGAPVDGNPDQRAGITQPYIFGPIFWLAWYMLGDTLTIIHADL
jgi:hypothetical protein